MNDFEKLKALMRKKSVALTGFTPTSFSTRTESLSRLERGSSWESRQMMSLAATASSGLDGYL